MVFYAERIKAKVRLVIADRIIEPGEVIVVDSVSAQMFVNTGRASYGTLIRARKADVKAGNRILAEGETGYVGEGLAVYLAGEGLAEIVDRDGLSQEARAALASYVPYRKSSPPPDPLAGFPVVALKAKAQNVKILNRIAAKGETVTNVPEPIACHLIHDGRAEIAPGSELTARGRTYVRALSRPFTGEVAHPEY